MLNLVLKGLSPVGTTRPSVPSAEEVARYGGPARSGGLGAHHPRHLVGFSMFLADP